MAKSNTWFGDALMAVPSKSVYVQVVPYNTLTPGIGIPAS
jgi:hypothetical protein